MNTTCDRVNLPCTIALLCLLSPPTASASDARMTVVSHWSAHQDRINSVRFTYKGHATTPAAYSPAVPDIEEPAYPLEELTHDIAGALLLDFEYGRIRMETKSEKAGEQGGRMFRAPFIQTAVFDGRLYKAFAPHDENLGRATVPVLRMASDFDISNRPLMDFIEVEHFPMLLAGGAILVNYSIDHSKLHTPLQVQQFRDTGTVDHNGIRCTVLQTVPDSNTGHFYEYWAATEAPRKIYRMMAYGRTKAEDDKPWFDIDISYRDTGDGPVPDRWKVLIYNVEQTKAKIFDVQLGDFEFNPQVADADFDLQPPPGTRVYDNTLPEDAQEYVQGELGEPNLPPVEFDMQQAQSSSRYRMAFGILAAVAIVIAVLVYRKRSAP